MSIVEAYINEVEHIAAEKVGRKSEIVLFPVSAFLQLTMKLAGE